MKRTVLEQALQQISDRHILQAAAPRKRRSLGWIAPVAAVLALVLLLQLGQPLLLRASAVAEAPNTRALSRPDYRYYDTFKTQEEYQAALDAYKAQQDQRTALRQQAMGNLSDFFTESSHRILTGETVENRVWSPVNGYIALAMLAEVTTGSSRQQILELLNTPDTQTLREQVSAVWESCYRKDGGEISTLANSLWLKKGLAYDQQVMEELAHHYYASVYQADLGAPSADRALIRWLNENTGNFLKDSAKNTDLSEEAVLALASTVYLQSKWSDEFSRSKSEEGLFHAPTGDVTCTFMHKKEYQTIYYWGDSYGAVNLGLKNGCSMWFFLPDADKTVEEVLAEGQYLEAICAPYSEEAEDRKYMKVNLSVPKFDIRSQQELTQALQALGVTDVFQASTADFSNALPTELPVWVSDISQAARVSIDEEGVKAAAYIVIEGAGAAAPPEEIIDFVLDRPFLFVITRDRLPLFTGVVANPA